MENSDLGFEVKVLLCNTHILLELLELILVAF